MNQTITNESENEQFEYEFHKVETLKICIIIIYS